MSVFPRVAFTLFFLSALIVIPLQVQSAVTWPLKQNLNITKLSKEIYDNCTIEVIKNSKLIGIDKDGMNKTIEWVTYKDPCNFPQQRRFMHCNPETLKCECYKNWLDTGGVPSYNDKNRYREAQHWFVYNRDAKECMVRNNDRCGVINEVSPYRCLNGRCVKSFYGDNFHWYCMNSDGFKSINVSKAPMLPIMLLLLFLS